jgi:hypothetical protein
VLGACVISGGSGDRRVLHLLELRVVSCRQGLRAPRGFDQVVRGPRLGPEEVVVVEVGDGREQQEHATDVAQRVGVRLEALLLGGVASGTAGGDRALAALPREPLPPRLALFGGLDALEARRRQRPEEDAGQDAEGRELLLGERAVDGEGLRAYDEAEIGLLALRRPGQDKSDST